MKNHPTKSRLLQLLVVFAVTGYFSAAQAQVVNVNVQLQLDSGQTRLDVITRGQFSNNNHNGCFVVRHGTQARINFSFVGNRQCNRASY